MGQTESRLIKGPCGRPPEGPVICCGHLQDKYTESLVGFKRFIWKEVGENGRRFCLLFFKTVQDKVVLKVFRRPAVGGLPKNIFLEAGF